MRYNIPAENYVRKPDNQNCYDFMKECAARISEDIGDYNAVVCYGCTVKVSRLCTEADKIADYLTEKGVKRGDVYAVFMPTSIHAFTMFYALNKIGAIAYFVHPLTPAAALEEMLIHTQAKGIAMLDLLAPAFTEVLKKHDSIICSPSDYGVAPVNDTLAWQSFDRAYLYRDVMNGSYTHVEGIHDNGSDTAVYMNGGGTTGRSKTVMLSSFALNSGAYETYLLDTPHEYGTRCSLAVLPCFHAYGLCDAMHYPVCNAYTAICMPRFDAHTANEIISKYKVALLLGVPNMFIKMFNEDNFENEGLKYLKHICAGGDALNESFREKFNAVLKRNGCEGELVAGYGMTEMTAICTTNSYSYCKVGSIGYPYESVELKIVDDDGKVLPPNAVGQIVTRGNTMMKGYLQDAYVKESGIFTDDSGKQWINTGDMGYLDEEGYLFFAARKKRIIIISGYNIYPSTIEEQVLTLDFVREACATTGIDENGKPCIKLTVSLTDTAFDNETAINKLKEFCSDRIEAYSVPRKIAVLENLPRTKMDKIDFLSLSEI